MKAEKSRIDRIEKKYDIISKCYDEYDEDTVVIDQI